MWRSLMGWNQALSCYYKMGVKRKKKKKMLNIRLNRIVELLDAGGKYRQQRKIKKKEEQRKKDRKTKTESDED